MSPRAALANESVLRMLSIKAGYEKLPRKIPVTSQRKAASILSTPPCKSPSVKGFRFDAVQISQNPTAYFTERCMRKILRPTPQIDIFIYMREGKYINNLLFLCMHSNVYTRKNFVIRVCVE